jgi:hypothetical protein
MVCNDPVNTLNTINIINLYIYIYKLYIKYIYIDYGGFLKWGYPKIIYFNVVVHYKPTSYWDPLMETPHEFYGFSMATVWLARAC